MNIHRQEKNNKKPPPTTRNFYLFLLPYTKIRLTWIIDPNINPKATQLLKENIEENLCDLGLGNNILEMI